MAADEPVTVQTTDDPVVDADDVYMADRDLEPDVQVATTWYAPNQQCVHADTLGPATVHATGANAGVPGAWTPAGSDAPNSVADLQRGIPLTVTANPATNWTVGQVVNTESGGAHWNGTAWVTGAHP